MVSHEVIEAVMVSCSEYVHVLRDEIRQTEINFQVQDCSKALTCNIASPMFHHQ